MRDDAVQRPGTVVPNLLPWCIRMAAPWPSGGHVASGLTLAQGTVVETGGPGYQRDHYLRREVEAPQHGGTQALLGQVIRGSEFMKTGLS